MATLSAVQSYLDKELRIAEIDDACVNGLEVAGREEIKTIVFMVDASEQGFVEAVKCHADMIIVHHGAFFGMVKRLTGNLYNRLRVLFENNISLYAAHLPLDIHPVWGNNAQIARILNLKNVQHYTVDKYENLLVMGDLPEQMSFNEFVELISSKINPEPRFLQFGPEAVKKVGIISGSGSDAAEIVARYGADVLLTGESKLSAYHAARESEINIVFAGHYCTEIFGLKALKDHIADKFNVQTYFLDIPTEL